MYVINQDSIQGSEAVLQGKYAIGVVGKDALHDLSVLPDRSYTQVYTCTWVTAGNFAVNWFLIKGHSTPNH